VRERAFIKIKRNSSGLSNRFAGQIVCRRAKPTCHHQKIGPLDCEFDGMNMIRKVVADRRVKTDMDSHLAKPLADPLRVGGQPLAAGHFVANRHHFGFAF
jgi:hypothetical protein